MNRRGSLPLLPPLQVLAGLLGLLAAYAWFSPPARAATLEEPVRCGELRQSREGSGEWTVLDLPGARHGIALGAPDLPYRQLLVRLPEGQHVTDVTWESNAPTVVELERPVVPYRGEQALDQPEPPVVEPDEALYASAALYPPAAARFIAEVEVTTGERYAVVRLYPVRYRPVTRELVFTPAGRLRLELDGPRAAVGLPRERAPLRAPAPSGSDGEVLWSAPGLAPTETPSVDGTPIEYAIVCAPDPAIEAAWQVLADWKTTLGHPAAVFTTDWIESRYPDGADQAERVRMFLQDAYTHWGLRWLLIGGDAEDVQVRYGMSSSFGYPHGTLIATDNYYACLEGNWDADGDGTFGESGTEVTGDYADTTPEIHVGRVSARTAEEVQDYLAKYFVYVQNPPLDGYLDRLLMLGEVLFDVEWERDGRGGQPDCNAEECTTENCRLDRNGTPICAHIDGADDCLEVRTLLADTLQVPLEQVIYLERAEYWNEQVPGLGAQIETSEAALTEMSNGYGFVHQVGHGDRDRWAVGVGRILSGDLVELTNGEEDHYFWAYGVNCHSAAIDYDCFGERLVLLPEHGALAYLGCTNADFPGTAARFVEDFYRFLWGADGRTIGDGFYGSIGANALTGDQINVEAVYTRFLLYTQILLGEPGMVVWQGTPEPLLVELVDHASGEVPLGTSSLVVSVTSNGSPIDSARICVRKEGEFYAVAVTGADGRVEIPFAPHSQGAFAVAATATGHLPALREDLSVTSAGGNPALIVEGLEVIDDGSQGSLGNGNGQIEAGEMVRLALSLGNAGDAPASGVQVTLRLAAGEAGEPAPETYVTLGDSTASFGTVAPGATLEDENAFLLSVDPRAAAPVFGEADLLRLPVTLLISAGSETEVAQSFEVTRPRLAVALNTIEHAFGSQYDLWVGVANPGKGAASELIATLEADDPYNEIRIIGTTQLALADIAPGESGQAGPFRIEILDALGRMTCRVTSTISSPAETLHVRTLDASPPATPDTLTLIGLDQAMLFSWNGVSDPGGESILGYRIYRADEGSTTYPEVLPGILEGHRLLRDMGLGDMTLYSYKVAAVDAGGNEGPVSSPIETYTTPPVAAGWPNQIASFTKCSPLICELDGYHQAHPEWGREIIFGGETIYAFHGNGDEVINGDSQERTRGPFAIATPDYRGEEFRGKAAAADIDNDGDVELVAIAFNSTNEGGANRGEVLCWGPWGYLEWVFGMQRGISWSSPTLADLDGDGLLEVIFTSGGTDQAGVYVIDCFGAPWGTADPVTAELRNLGGTNLFQSPAVGDVDGNGTLDIAIPTRNSNDANGRLYVLNSNGTDLTGFTAGLRFADFGVPDHTTAPATLCNVDGIAGDEVFVSTLNQLWCFRKSGSTLWTLDYNGTYSLGAHELMPEPALGDIDGNGKVDVAIIDDHGTLWAVSAATGTSIDPETFPLQLDSRYLYGSCLLANVDDEPRPEIVFCDNAQRVYAYRYDGTVARGFPIYFGGDMKNQTPAIWDVNMDGRTDLVVQSHFTQKLGVYSLENTVFPTNESQQASQYPWPMRHRDSRNTGRYTLEMAVDVQIAMLAPLVSAGGEVELGWNCAAPVAVFRIWRAAVGSGVEELVGTVGGESGGGGGGFAFVDRPPQTGTYVYRVSPVYPGGGEGQGAQVAVSVETTGAQVAFGFARVVPEPLAAGAMTRITFGLAGSAGEAIATRLSAFDIQGRRVRLLLAEPLAAGTHEINFDGRDEAGRALPAGLYLLRLEAQGRAAQRRLLVVR